MDSTLLWRIACIFYFMPKKVNQMPSKGKLAVFRPHHRWCSSSIWITPSSLWQGLFVSLYSTAFKISHSINSDIMGAKCQLMLNLLVQTFLVPISFILWKIELWTNMEPMSKVLL